MLTSLRSTLKSTPGMNRGLMLERLACQNAQNREEAPVLGAAQRGTSPPGVVVADVIGDFLSCCVLVGVRFHFQFGLDGAKARLHEGVVVAVLGAAHALRHARPGQQLAIFGAGVLASPVCVVDQAGPGLPQGDGSPQRGQNQRFSHVILQIPADDPPCP
jgi:hypothetical protein